ncbi:hypothetical protein WJX73_000372 [Symbiochloris irregularis]|uniref:RRM domain-containing protein n=1 Tax=Symbiochloris irregularis TaxID=706552 RepID=A0AAW1PDF3_9CHLO
MSRRDRASRTSLLIRNLPLDIRPDDLRYKFERYGEIRDVYLPRDYHSNRPKGFGFVEYVEERDAEDALYAMDGKLFGNREIAVVMSKDSRKTPRDMMVRDDSATRSRGRHRSRSRSRSRGRRRRSRSRSRSRSPRRDRERSSRHRSRHSDRTPPRRERSYSPSPHPQRSASRSRSRGRSVHEREAAREHSASPIRHAHSPAADAAPVNGVAADEALGSPDRADQENMTPVSNE